MPKRILIVEDYEVIRNSFFLILEDMGYMVETAETGEKAIAMAKEKKYDLIFLDLKMPGLNGVETLRELRKIDKDVPVYIITAFYDEFYDELRRAHKEGIDFELMKKPIRGEQLATVVKGILGSESG